MPDGAVEPAACCDRGTHDGVHDHPGIDHSRGALSHRIGGSDNQ